MTDHRVRKGEKHQENEVVFKSSFVENFDIVKIRSNGVILLELIRVSFPGEISLFE
jgi:hypothetical protein